MEGKDTPDRAKLFKSGGSQAVRLPKAYRFEKQDEVFVYRSGQRVILEPKRRRWSAEFIALAGAAKDFPYPPEPAAGRAWPRPRPMKYLLDSNVCVDRKKGDSEEEVARRRLEPPEHPITTSSVMMEPGLNSGERPSIVRAKERTCVQVYDEIARLNSIHPSLGSRSDVH